MSSGLFGAWIALADRDTTRAIARMREVADREDKSEKHVAMENRLSPMRELLGELLLEAGHPPAAVRREEGLGPSGPSRITGIRSTSTPSNVA